MVVIRITRKSSTILETSINQEEEVMMMKATAVAVVVAEAAVEVEVVAEGEAAEVKVVEEVKVAEEVEEEMTIMMTTMIMEMKTEVLIMILNQKSQKEDNQNLREVVVKEVAARKLEREVALKNLEEVDLRLLVLLLEELH